MHDLDRNLRSMSSRIRAALETHGCACEIPSEIGSLARALAASKATGSFLCIGEGAGEVAAWMLDGMDHSSGVVALVQNQKEASVLERELDRDVRASVHLQEPEDFFADVAAHQFDLIVDLIAADHAAAVTLGLGQLRSGGIYLASHFDGDLRQTLAGVVSAPQGSPQRVEPECFAVARLSSSNGATIIVRRAGRMRPTRRSIPRNR